MDAILPVDCLGGKDQRFFRRPWGTRRKAPQDGEEGTFAVPADCDWFIWRLLLSERLKVSSPEDLDLHWTYTDMVEAHEMLDAIEDALQRDYDRIKREARALAAKSGRTR
jgi:hypothetical protein